MTMTRATHNPAPLTPPVGFFEPPDHTSEAGCRNEASMATSLPPSLNYYSTELPDAIYGSLPTQPSFSCSGPTINVYDRPADGNNDQICEQSNFLDGPRYIYQAGRSQLISAEHPYGVKRKRSHHNESSTYSSPLTPQSIEGETIYTRSRRGHSRTPQTLEDPRQEIRKKPTPRRKPARKKARSGKEVIIREPLSELTKSMYDIPIRDMEQYVHRSLEVRQAEAANANKIKRPMNSFMLYRSAYAERTKRWCLDNNHQVVSTVSGTSWPKEPAEIRNFYTELAEIERTNHRNAHPGYKFTPSKGGSGVRPLIAPNSDDDGGSSDPFESLNSTHTTRQGTPMSSRSARSTLSRSHTPYSEMQQMPSSRPLPNFIGSYNNNFPYGVGINNGQYYTLLPSHLVDPGHHPFMIPPAPMKDVHSQSTRRSNISSFEYSQNFSDASDVLKGFDQIDPSILNAYRAEHNPVLAALPSGSGDVTLDNNGSHHHQTWDGVLDMGVHCETQTINSSMESGLENREFEDLFNEGGFA